MLYQMWSNERDQGDRSPAVLVWHVSLWHSDGFNFQTSDTSDLSYSTVASSYQQVTYLNVYFRATVSAVSCLVVPAFICIDLLYSCALKLNDDDDDDLSGLTMQL